MTLKYMMGGTIRGQRYDTKPTTLIPIGTKFEELDTGITWLFDGSKWQYWGRTEEARDFFKANHEGSPHVLITGDEFTKKEESSLYNLSDLTSAIGGGVLTNNNGVTFVEETDLPLRGYKVGNFVAASSQYLSRATEAQFEVGTGSFIASCRFKTSILATYQKIIDYGSAVAGKAYYRLHIDSTGKISFSIKDTSGNSAALTDTIANTFIDGKWHTAIAVIDRTLNILFLLVDGKLIGSTSISAVTATLTIAGENFHIGTGKDAAGALGSYFEGRIADVRIIKDIDWNAVRVITQNYRERVNKNSITALSADSGARLNNQFQLTHASGDYATAVIDLEEGIYDVIEVYRKGTDAGISELLLDEHAIRAGIDGYNASTTFNNKTITTGLKVFGGRHILKVRCTSKNGSASDFRTYYQYIIFVKREGHEQGGLTEALLLLDELNQRANTTDWAFANQTAEFYDSRFNNATTPIDGDATEGDLFYKAGLFRIDICYVKSTDVGKLDLDIGNVEVLDQLDGYNGSTTQNNITTKYGRLNQGKQITKLALNGKNASSSSYVFTTNFLKLKRLAN